MKPITEFEKKMRLIFGLAFAILLSTVVVSLFVIHKLHDNDEWVAHTHEVVANINLVHVQVGNARVSTKNYLLTGESRHLAPRISALQEVRQGMAHLKSLTEDNPTQQNNIVATNKAIDDYEQLTAKIIQEVDESAQVVPRSKFAQWTDLTEPGGKKIASCLVGMVEEEEGLLRQREKVASSFVNQAYGIMPFMLALQIFITAYIYYGVLNVRNVSY